MYTAWGSLGIPAIRLEPCNLPIQTGLHNNPTKHKYVSGVQLQSTPCLKLPLTHSVKQTRLLNLKIHQHASAGVSQREAHCP